MKELRHFSKRFAHLRSLKLIIYWIFAVIVKATSSNWIQTPLTSIYSDYLQRSLWNMLDIYGRCPHTWCFTHSLKDAEAAFCSFISWWYLHQCTMFISIFHSCISLCFCLQTNDCVFPVCEVHRSRQNLRNVCKLEKKIRFNALYWMVCGALYRKKRVGVFISLFDIVPDV